MCTLDNDVNSLISSAFMSFGWIDEPHSLPLYGWARNVSLSTSSLLIPVVGIESSEGRYSDPNGTALPTVNGVTIYLGSNLASGAGNLSFAFKNVSTSTTSNSGTLSVGNASASVTFGTGITVSSGDKIAIVLSMASGSLVLPSLQWGIGL